MTQESEVPADATALISAYQNRTLLGHIFNRFDCADEPTVAAILDICVSLHNAGVIDLLSLTEGADFEELNPTTFFTGQHFLCDLIPKLKAATTSMVHFVNALVMKGGNDLMAGSPNGAFREWCKVDVERSQEVISLANQGDEQAVRVLSFALNAENNIDTAKIFVETYSDERRLAAITALSRMKFENADKARNIIQTLNSILETGPGDFPVALILASVLEIVDKSAELTWEDSIEVLKNACKAPGAQTHFACARSLWIYDKQLSEEVVTSLLDALTSLDATHKGTISELDHGLRKLLGTAHADRAIRFLENLLSRDNGGLALSQFPTAGSALIEGPTDRFHQVFVSWLLTGNPALCTGLEKLMSRKDRDKAINLSISPLHLTRMQKLFLCRKAIGFFFIEPVIASSVLVSVLRDSDEQGAVLVRELLIDPLLRNYGGGAKDYLKTIRSDDPSFEHVDFALKEHEKYSQDLHSAPEVKELHPSEHQRQIEHLRFHDQMSAAQKTAMKESVFLNLIRRSVILYGRRTMTFVEGPNNERRAVEMDMQSHGVSMEVPRGDIFDPVGLNYMLLVFRGERFVS
ncbi:MAG: hypothetical protein ABIL01_13270 [Pseudomonadota bacterium]